MFYFPALVVLVEFIRELPMIKVFFLTPILCDTGKCLYRAAFFWAVCPKVSRIQVNKFLSSLTIKVERFVNWDSSLNYLNFDVFVETLFIIQMPLLWTAVNIHVNNHVSKVNILIWVPPHRSDHILLAEEEQRWFLRLEVTIYWSVLPPSKSCGGTESLPSFW